MKLLIGLIYVALLMVAQPALARVYLNESGEEVRTEERIEREFTLAQGGSLDMTVACEAGQAGHLRIYIYERSLQGGWREIDRLRIRTRNSIAETTDDFTLPAGEYMVVISARRMAYSVKIEDTPDE